MSKVFAQSFFPSFTSFVSSPNLAPSFLVIAWDAIFPDDVGAICGLPQDASILHLSRPCLGVAAMIGAYIGLKSRSFKDGRGNQNDYVSDRGMLGFCIYEAWTKSRTAFGLMNLVALAHHCIVPPRKSYHSFNSHRKLVDNLLWAADCIFTGVSSIHLTIMALLIYRLYAVKKNSSDVTSLTRSTFRMKMIVSMSLVSFASSLSILHQLCRNERIDLWAATGTFTEMIYLIPLASASLFLFPLVIHSASKMCPVKNSFTGARIAILGGIFVLMSLPLDSSLCYFVSSNAPSIKTSPLFYDIFHLPTLVFLGCDLSFLGLDMWLNSLMHELIEQNKKEF